MQSNHSLEDQIIFLKKELQKERERRNKLEQKMKRNEEQFDRLLKVTSINPKEEEKIIESSKQFINRDSLVSKESEYFGWLEIMSRNKIWKKRFFGLREGKYITFSKKESRFVASKVDFNSIEWISNLKWRINDPENIGDKVSVFALRGARVQQKVILNGKIQELCFNIRLYKKDLLVRASSIEEKEEWCSKLNDNIAMYCKIDLLTM